MKGQKIKLKILNRAIVAFEATPQYLCTIVLEVFIPIEPPLPLPAEAILSQLPKGLPNTL